MTGLCHVAAAGEAVAGVGLGPGALGGLPASAHGLDCVVPHGRCDKGGWVGEWVLRSLLAARVTPLQRLKGVGPATGELSETYHGQQVLGWTVRCPTAGVAKVGGWVGEWVLWQLAAARMTPLCRAWAQPQVSADSFGVGPHPPPSRQSLGCRPHADVAAPTLQATQPPPCKPAPSLTPPRAVTCQLNVCTLGQSVVRCEEGESQCLNLSAKPRRPG